MNGLVLSCLLHIGYALYFYYKSKCFSIHNLISIWFAVVSIIGWITVETGIYQAVHGDIVHFPYQPYVLEFVAFCVFMWPFRFLNSPGIYIDEKSVSNLYIYRFVINGLLLLFLLYLFVLAKSSYYISTHKDLVDAYDSLHNSGKTTYNYSDFETKILWICGSLFRWFSPIILLFAINGLSLDRKKNRPYYIRCLVICMSCNFLSYVSTGQRGATFFFTVTLTFWFIPYWKSFSKGVKHLFLSMTPVVLFIFFMYAAVMTIQRTENSATETPVTSVLRYLGEPYPHLGNKYWEKVHTHPMGMRLYPFWVSPNEILKQNKALSDQHEIWGIITGVPILNYKTLYGDFYVEFGTWLPFIFIASYAFLLYLFTRKRKVHFWAFPILYYYLEMATMAPFLFTKREWSGIRDLIAVCLIFFVFKHLINPNGVSKKT